MNLISEFSLRKLITTVVGLAFAYFIFLMDAQAEDYRAVYARVQSKLSQINSLETEINHLIDAKNHAATPDKQKMYVDEMIQVHGQMRKTFEEYDKELTRLRYQYPDQGEDFQRKYPRIELKSLDDMERKYGLNGELDRLKIKRRQIYGIPMATQSRKPASKPPKYEWYEPPALLK